MREAELESVLSDILRLVETWQDGAGNPRMTGGRFLLMATWAENHEHIEDPEMREVIDTFNRARRLLGL